MDGQEQGEDHDVRPERRDAPGRVDRDDIGVEAEEVGIEVGDEDGQAVAEDEQPDQPERVFP